MSSALPLDVQNLFEDQIDSRIESAINRYDARSGEYPAVVTRKGSDGMWWCRVVGNEEETPIMTALTEMSVGDTIRLVIKDGRTTAQGNESAPAATSTSVNYVVQGSVAPLLNDIDDLKIGKIDVREFNAETAKINELMADKANITDLTAATGRITTLETNALTANSAVVLNLLAEAEKVHNLTAIDLESAVGYIVDLTAEGIDVEALTADHAAVATLDTDYAKIYNGVIVNANIDHANVNGLDAVYAQIDAANITEAAIKQTWADTIMVQTGLLAKEVKAGEGTVYSLDAIEVNALNITAGTLDVERLIVTIDGEKYLFNTKSLYNHTSDASLYELSSTKYIYVGTGDTEVDPEKTYYEYDGSTGLYQEVANPVDEDISEYYEKVVPEFDPETVYYVYDSVLDEYQIVDDPVEADFASYYQLANPDKIYYEYDSETDSYLPVANPVEEDLSEYYERVDASDYVKLDGNVLQERTITGNKILANSITAREITAENLEGTGGWINLAEGTFRYVNAQTGSGIAWDGQHLSIFGGYTDETAIMQDVVGISDWLRENTSRSTDIEARPGSKYFVRVDDAYEETYFPTTDLVVDRDKTYYESQIEYVPTLDTVPDESKTYYVLENDEYTVVSDPQSSDIGSYYEQATVYSSVEPVGTENPSGEGWYEREEVPTFSAFSEIDYDKIVSTYSPTVDDEIDSRKTYYEQLSAYSKTQDVYLDGTKTYYILEDGQYVPVQEPSEAELENYYEVIYLYSAVTPVGDENPSIEGWYEKGNPSLQGLYVLDENLYSFLASHISDNGDGTVLKDGNSGYSLKIAQDGFYIYDDGGNVVGKYGESMQVGSMAGTHMVADGNHLGFVTGDGNEVAYIDVDPNTKESVFYMTRSVVVKDMFFGEGLWKWYKRANNNMSLKWMGAS